MTNWFQTHNINPIYGWGPSKRMIIQAGPAVEDGCAFSLEDATLQFRGLVERARKAGCVYVEIRCFEDYSAYRPALEVAGFEYEPHYDVHISLTPNSDNASPAERGNGTGEGEIPMWIHESKRRQIRAAIAEGQSWREVSLEDATLQFRGDSLGDAALQFRGDSLGDAALRFRGDDYRTFEEDLREWYACLKKLYRKKVKRPIPSLDWFRTMILEKGCKLLVVESSLEDGINDANSLEFRGRRKIVGGVLLAVEDDKSKAYEWYICGQVMSTWAAIDWCRQHNVRCFDTMGAGRPGVPYGVRDFKLQMGGTLHEFGRYRCVLRPFIYRLGQLLFDRKKRSAP